MYSGRYNAGPPSVARKTKPDARPSLLPKPRRTGSTDRASTEARRPSASYRSSSAEPSRATLAAGGRLSREASASKLPLNKARSRSQQSDRYGQVSMTPLRSSQYARTTTTPMRTPSEDRQSRSWQVSLDRAIAFVTVKDQRPLSNNAWQRAEYARVLEALTARGMAGLSGQPALTRPLTITRFVDVCGELLSAIMSNTKLNNDNYIAKLPNLAKRFLYPGAVSKSWLKTVNALHAFPHALAFIAYFLDLVTHIETPVSEEWLYADKDELSCLRRDFLNKSWIRFQETNPKFDDLDAEYLESLKQLLGHDEGYAQQLQESILRCKAALEDETELAARAQEERVRARRDALLARGKAVRAERRDLRAGIDRERARATEQQGVVRSLDTDIQNITDEIQRLKVQLERQDITVSERAQLLDQVDYATRVVDSKRTLAVQVSKIMVSKETELAGWQKRTLDSCVEYKQALIHLSARFPDLAALAIDERELMSPMCALAVSRGVDTLRGVLQQAGERRAQIQRARSTHSRARAVRLEETRALIAELKSTIAREEQALEAEEARESAYAASWAAEKAQTMARLEALAASEEGFRRAQTELDFWEKQEIAWRTRLSEMQQYTDSLRAELSKRREEGQKTRAGRVRDVISEWQLALDRLEADEQRDASTQAAH